MTVKELIAQLEKLDGSLLVVVPCNGFSEYHSPLFDVVPAKYTPLNANSYEGELDLSATEELNAVYLEPQI